MEVGALVKDQYRVIEHIGRGGMADVWSARDQRLRRMVAIKTIAKGLSPDVDPVSLFEREAQTIAVMEHPHILPIYDFGEYEGNLYIVMRFMTSGSLEGLLEQGPMEPGEVVRMGRSIGQALDYAHSNNIIHLDLKPPNILLDSSRAPYLADFGLATVLDPEGRARNPGSGTLLYMAPEQLVAEVIDHRADIYSFCIMLYHMFTGRLPFDGTSPLAFRQLQANDQLPALEEQLPGITYHITDILRYGTAARPEERPRTHMEIMDQIESILSGGATVEVPGLAYDPFAEGESDLNLVTQAGLGSMDAELLEAVDIYSRARHNWAGGQGRFLLGLTHYMLMANYYIEAEHHKLTIDDAGYQMLLRGAIEYDHEIEHWWAQLSDGDRRLVCLHTLRGGTTPARIRAFYRLETLPDDETRPVIPKLVSQALEVESDEEAKMAALHVLSTRARLVKPQQQYAIKTEFRGRLLTSMTRLGIELAPPSDWVEAIYTPEIDLLVAETCFDQDSERVAQYAARTVGRMRSLTAVRYIANQHHEGRSGALRALALVRDEAPSLPDVVPPQARLYAWLTNTVRRLTDRPLDGIWRFVLALLGGWVGMGEVVYTTFRSQALFTPQRWGNTIAIGLVFGLFVGSTVMLSDEFSRRLRGFWLWWLRLLVFGLMGLLMGLLTWSGFTWMYLQYIPLWDVMRLAAFALAFGLTMSALLDIYGWRSVLLVTSTILLPILALHQNFYYKDQFTIFPAAGIGLFYGILVGWLAARRMGYESGGILPVRPGVQIGLGALIGLGWVTMVWLFYGWLYQRQVEGIGIDWDGVLAIIFGAVLFGTLMAYILHHSARLTFALTALVGFALVYVSLEWKFFDQTIPFPPLLDMPLTVVYSQGVPLQPRPEVPIIYFDQRSVMLPIILPMAFVIALGANGQALLSGWWNWIGKPRAVRERSAWLTAGLVYTLGLSTLVSVLSLFNAHLDVAWAIGWSLWGFVAFVFALAAWRWARWGATGLLVAGITLIVGGFLADARDMAQALASNTFPALFQPALGQLPGFVGWTAFAVVLSLLVWGASRARLWAGIGLALSIPAWFFITLFTPVPGSLVMLSLASVAFVFYGLRVEWTEFEVDRFRWPQWRRPTSAPASTTPSAAPAAPVQQRRMGDTQVAGFNLNTVQVPDYPSQPQSMRTEIDAASALDRAEQGAAEEMPSMELPAYNPAPDLRTELDPGAHLAQPRPANDLSEPPRPSGGMQTEIEPGAGLNKPKLSFDTSDVKHSPGSMQTEIEPGAGLNKPKLSFDTSDVKHSPGSMQTELDPGAGLKKPKLSFDTSDVKHSPGSMQTELDARIRPPAPGHAPDDEPPVLSDGPPPTPSPDENDD